MKDNQMNERKLFEEFYKTITPAVPQAGYEDISMDAAYLSWQERAKLTTSQVSEPIYQEKTIFKYGNKWCWGDIEQSKYGSEDTEYRIVYLHPPTTPQEAISPAIAEYVKALEGALKESIALRVALYKHGDFDGITDRMTDEQVANRDMYAKKYTNVLASKPTGLE